MRIPRIHLDRPLAVGTELELGREAGRHLLQVMRLRHGQPLTLFNGDGRDYAAELLVAGKSARARISAARDNRSESPCRVTLVQAVSKGERMDYTLQKSVELGVAAIRPVFSQRSVVRLDGARLERKLLHWRGVIASACEQCGRSRLPPLLPALELSAWLADGGRERGERELLLAPDAPVGLGQIEPGGASFTLLIGPEGGLAEAEIAAARAAGFSAVRLGPRVLRTETAALAALAVLQARCGDLG